VSIGVPDSPAASKPAPPYRRREVRPGLRNSLSTLQAFTVSLTITSPTLAMAFTVALATQAAGRAAPLAFLLGGIATALIGLSFVAFARRIASAGSVAAYVGIVFGQRWGFLAGWALLLTYLAFMASASALVGEFVTIALEHVGIRMPGLWLAIALLAVGLAIVLAGREIRRLAHLMLAIEACAVVAILVLAAVILVHVPWSTAPFRADRDHGRSGLGYAIAFAVMSFAGFEGAATVAEETHNPRRAIPRAILGSVIVVGVLYVVVSYAQVLGFGLEPSQLASLGQSEAPLDALAQRYISGSYGVVLDLAAGISSLGLALGAASAAARLLFAMGRAGFGGGLGLGTIDAQHGTPRRAVWLVGSLNLLSLLTLAPWAGSRVYAEASATIGTLAVLLVYVGIGVAQAIEAGRERRHPWMVVGLLGAAALAWPLFTSLYSAPPWPGNLWPFVVILWMAIGVVIGWSGRRGTGASADTTDVQPTF
jgi:amino acid transporter